MTTSIAPSWTEPRSASSRSRPTARGRILGATIVARGAGELILPFVLARRHGLTLSSIANTVFPYPTMAEGVKRASAEFLRSRLDTTAGRTLKRVVQWLK